MLYDASDCVMVVFFMLPCVCYVSAAQDIYRLAMVAKFRKQAEFVCCFDDTVFEDWFCFQVGRSPAFIFIFMLESPLLLRSDRPKLDETDLGIL